MSAPMVVHSNWCRACKCFPLIGSQKSFITQGEYRYAAAGHLKRNSI